ncbi:MAG: hypothetical protein H6970_09770 [Gammaproteobacteria bacterium]|nr:hypothetical protein [Gammaproteobacteria bacterium]
MSTQDISKAKDPDLRASLIAVQRAAALARKTAIQTDTAIVVVKNHKLVRVSAAELREDTDSKPAGDTTLDTLPGMKVGVSRGKDG